VNTDDLEPALAEAEQRVLAIQAKLHQWARDDPHRRFCDLFNLVTDPAFLLVAWARVRGNKGARTAGVDGQSAYSIEARRGVGNFLGELRTALKDRSFRPLPVRERMIPKAGGKLRRLGIATITDRGRKDGPVAISSQIYLSSGRTDLRGTRVPGLATSQRQERFAARRKAARKAISRVPAHGPMPPLV